MIRAVIREESEKGGKKMKGDSANKAENKKGGIPNHSSKEVVVRLDETDKLRMQQLTGNRS